MRSRALCRCLLLRAVFQFASVGFSLSRISTAVKLRLWQLSTSVFEDQHHFSCNHFQGFDRLSFHLRVNRLFLLAMVSGSEVP
ncbi:hypothetical protein IWX47DRAFT_865050, partial [Phyllosticta citricarpa]